MRIDVITLFPESLEELADLGVTGRAIREGRVQLKTWNPRDLATDRHRTVDDRPYGGGPGMVMAVEPLSSTIAAARQEHAVWCGSRATQGSGSKARLRGHQRPARPRTGRRDVAHDCH